jgi:translation initiation factor IF-1
MPRLFPVRFPSLAFVSKDVIELIGIVEETFPNATFRVKILSPQAKDHELHCHLAGRMRVNRVHILPGDKVRVEMTPYDLQKGRIVYRFRSDQRFSEDGTPIMNTPSSSPPPSRPHHRR